MNVRRRNMNYQKLAFGITVAVAGVAMAIVAFQSLLLRSSGIALCLCGVYLVKRSLLHQRPATVYEVTSRSRKIYLAFIITIGFTALTYTLLYVVGDDLFGIIVLYSFISSGALATLVGTFLLCQWVYRKFK